LQQLPLVGWARSGWGLVKFPLAVAKVHAAAPWRAGLIITILGLLLTVIVT
jgi:hypothetical protein